MIYAIVSLLVVTSYVIACVWRWGVPVSLSRTFFSIRHKWIFSAVLFVSFGLLLYPLMHCLSDKYQWLGFFTVAGGLFIAAAPNLEDNMQEQTHMGGAIVLALASQSIAALLHPLLLPLWVLWTPFVLGSSRVFWAEMIGGLIFFASVIMELL